MMKKEDVTTSQSDASYQSQTRLYELDHNGSLPLSDPLYRLFTILEPKVYPWPNTSKNHLLTEYVNDCTKHSTTNNYFADFYCMKGRIHYSFEQKCGTVNKNHWDQQYWEQDSTSSSWSIRSEEVTMWLIHQDGQTTLQWCVQLFNKT